MASTIPEDVINDDPVSGPKPLRRKFILCFDGTGNKFLGNAGDSNILKIYSMLDKADGAQFHYYQPGIGTYTTRNSLSSNGVISRMSSAYNKAKDSALGTTIDEHVMSGYRFLMRYYQTGDDIYFFGFSRGAYIARFLAEMLDHVGLLSAGNEELVRFVWKTFAKWQARQGGRSEEEKRKAADHFKFMTAFRETFSRPVRRIRFLGLFDTVNSVSKFETAWLQRSGKFPYTARSSAIVIRHAVAIDERRAKFRQDLISQKKDKCTAHSASGVLGGQNTANGHITHNDNTDYNLRFRRPSKTMLTLPGEFKTDRFRSRSRGRSRSNARRRHSVQSSLNDDCDSDEEDERIVQDVEELWFPGGHADIGGGWPPDEPEKLALSHGPLVWMVREAQKAGLAFIPEKMKELDCLYVEVIDKQSPTIDTTVPQIEVNDNPISPVETIKTTGGLTDGEMNVNAEFLGVLQSSCTRARIHDCLEFSSGIPAMSVLSWRVMEYLPFRRMDLQKDGSWKPIRWPLPMGETRDIPDDVKVHNSAIRRMRADPNYRPGNLICRRGGGRGKRKAPKSLGMGEWELLKGEGHPVEEVWVKTKTGLTEKKKSNTSQ